MGLSAGRTLEGYPGVAMATLIFQYFLHKIVLKYAKYSKAQNPESLEAQKPKSSEGL